MVLRHERIRFNSYFGLGCIPAGHPVGTRPLNGVSITRPPFERLSNILVNFPNEIGVAGLASFYSNSPWFGILKETIPFYGWKPWNYPYDGPSDGARAGIASLLSDLVLNGIDGVRRRSLMGAPSHENPVKHANLVGSLTNQVGRVKSVGYSGSINGYPKFIANQTAPARVSVTSIALDTYTVNKGSTQNYTGLTCFLRDALVNMSSRVNSGLHNTTWANAGVSAMKFRETYDSFTWELVPEDPYAVFSVSYKYTLNLKDAPIFDEEEMVYSITVSWEFLNPTPWYGTGVAPVFHDLKVMPSLKIRQTYSCVLLSQVVTNLVGSAIYQWSKASSFSEIYDLPVHCTSGKELYTERLLNVRDLLRSSDTSSRQYSTGDRIALFNSEVERDLVNFQPLRFMAFTDAVTERLDQIQTNLIETFSELRQLLSLVNFPAYLRKVNKLKNAGRNPKAILDVLSSSYLTYKYGLMPTIGMAEDLLVNLRPALETVNMLTEDSEVTYGSKTFTLPSPTYGYQSVTVIATSKVVGRFNLTGFFLGAYMLDSIGLFPTLERIWDIVDYSFVADMFFNIDDRLQILDNGLRTVGFVLDYHVSTIEIRADIDISSLTVRGLQPTGLEAPGLRYFGRSVSKYTPRLGTSTYDFVAPGNPDWIAIGSLIYQKLS